MWINEDTRASLIIGWLFIAILTLAYYGKGMNKRPIVHEEFTDDEEVRAAHESVEGATTTK